MMRLPLCLVVCLASSVAAFGAPVEQGGRDVSVALFTTRDVRAVTLTPLVPGAWTAACAACAHTALRAPLVVSSGEVFAGGSLRVAAGAEASATAVGLWHVRAEAHGVDVVLTMPSERYTAAAVSAEAEAGEPQESLRALAVVARTYALNGPHYTAGAGHLPAALCDSTQCQALRLGPVPAAVDDAVRATAGETVWFGSARAEVFFSQHCGGVTADGSELWARSDGAKPAPYLRSHADPYCLRRGPAAWHATVSLGELNAIAQQEGWRLPAHTVQVSVAQRTPSGRVAKLLLRGADGTASPLSASALRFGIGRALGWNRVRSDLYDVALRNGSLVFDGRGHGHGVGLCQAGATEMATEHRDTRAILAFYFPGTRVGVSANDAGWMEMRTGAVRVRSVAALLTSTRDAMDAAWQSALQRFPAAKPPEPLVVIAPSTEMYRQMTGQPGWNLASTRGNVVTLQPEQVLRKAGADEALTLRHEFLHVLIESEATDRVPLWLREGLAEALAGDTAAVAARTDPGLDTDTLLQHANSMGEANAAHRAADARVHAMIERYGLSTVRGWLRSGVPATVAAGR